MKLISKKEYLFLFIWSFILIGLVLFLYGYGFLNTPENKQFMHLILPSFGDHNSYLAFIKQASEGHLLFQDLYTTEPQSRLYFNPAYLTIGLFNYLFKIPVIISWYFFIIISNFFLLFSLYYFIAYFVKKIDQRILIFIFLTLGAGFGWLLGIDAADIMLAETTIFQVLFWPFLWSLALGLLVWIFLFAIQSFEENNFNKSIYAGILLLVLALAHSYDVLMAYTILGAYILFFTNFFENFKKIIAIFLPSVFVVIYNLLILIFDPVLAIHSQVPMWSPPPVNYIAGFGIIFFLGLWGLKIIMKNREKKYYFLVLWLILGFLLLYFPVPFQRRLILGLEVPLVIIASRGLFNFSYKEKIPIPLSRRIFSYALILLVISFSSLTSLKVYKNIYQEIKRGDYPFYLEKEIIEGTAWLETNTNSEDIVIASYEIGNFIPRLSGNKVYAGHWAQTLFLEQKLTQLNWFLNENSSLEKKDKFLEENGIKYIFYTPETEKSEFLEKAIVRQYWPLVYENSQVKIFKIPFRK